MNFAEMTIEQMEERKAAIATEIEAQDADLDALEAEVRSINEELEKRKNAEAKRVELRAAVAAGAGVAVKEFKEERKMPEIETRNTKAYIDAYANYIKTNDDTECRALLSTNGTDSTSPALTGYVPVPDIVDSTIRTAWEKNNVMSLVRKTNLKGNVKVGFELSATGAVVHKEGRDAPDEEVITLGIVTMIPMAIKKWIGCEAA